jgi:probable RNA-binding protein EIF1AD
MGNSGDAPRTPPGKRRAAPNIFFLFPLPLECTILDARQHFHPNISQVFLLHPTISINTRSARSNFNMGRPKRNVFAAAEKTSTPPSSLTPTQAIARVIKAEGNCLYSCTLPDQKTVLVELPSRFRNTIWIKRGGYVLIDTKEADVRQNKIDGEIINVVRGEHLWRKEAYW